MRDSANKRGYGIKWQQYREAFLRAHPLCADHESRGMVVAATVVDHIVPHRLGVAINGGVVEQISAARKLFWSINNHQALCKPCHDGAKRREEMGGGKPGCSSSGVPLDPAHHWNKK